MKKSETPSERAFFAGLARGRAFHAYALDGPEETVTATAFAAAPLLLCIEKPPCGRCNTCLSLAAGSHPDLRWARAEGSQWSIDEARELRREAFYRPLLAPRRVLVVEGADRMSQPAANAWLKLLEEPPADLVVFLLVQDWPGVLETIRSRCIRVQLGRPADDEPVDATESVRIWAQALPQYNVVQILDMAEQLAQPDGQLEHWLRTLLRLLRDQLVFPLGRLANGAEAQAVRTHWGDVAVERLQLGAAVVSEALAALRYPMNRRLTAEVTLIRLQQTLFGE